MFAPLLEAWFAEDSQQVMAGVLHVRSHVIRQLVNPSTITRAFEKRPSSACSKPVYSFGTMAKKQSQLCEACYIKAFFLTSIVS